jgi:hypothetical protein
MLTKWFLAATLFCCITLTATAAPQPKDAPILVELRGKLVITGPQLMQNPLKEPAIQSCLPPLWEYALEVRGRRFHLLFSRSAAPDQKLNGQVVIVKGTLDLDTVNVADLSEPKDDAPIQFAHATVTGTLEHEIEQVFLRCGQPYNAVVWRVRSGEVTFTLQFPNAELEAKARELVGKKVVVSGGLQDGTINVRTVAPVSIDRLLLPLTK